MEKIKIISLGLSIGTFPPITKNLMNISIECQMAGCARLLCIQSSPQNLAIKII